ncbi:MAG: hypothetical protein JST39_13130 [Bacteroidetes bacterium]|nr:hypothetical protein [Bacteroidota bacterium]
MLFATAYLFTTNVHAQSTTVTPRNSWFKLGVNLGVPVGKTSDYSNFTAGLELKGQVLETNNIGIGIGTGYNHFFAKDGLKDFGIIPLDAFIRVYPESKGFFLGTDAGYGFITGISGATGGFNIKPQLGYHNYSWNVFGYYDGVLRSSTDGGTISSVGIGATYNIR